MMLLVGPIDRDRDLYGNHLVVPCPGSIGGILRTILTTKCRCCRFSRSISSHGGPGCDFWLACWRGVLQKMAAGEINRVLLYDIYAITGVTLDRTTTCKCSVFKHRRVSVGHHKMSYTALRAP